MHREVVMLREQAGASWLPRPKQASMLPWSGVSPGAAIVAAEALKLEATKLEILKLEALVADRIQIKPGALGATQAQLHWQAAAAAAAAENQTPSSSLPPTAPWQTANNPAAVAAIAAVRAAEAARRQANARALAIERGRANPDKAEAARRQAKAEGLTLQRSDNAAGYRGVYSVYRCRKTSPFKARVRRGGKQVNLGYYDTAEEAALAYARTPEAQEELLNAKPAPLKAEEALTQASAEGLTLERSEGAAGYKGVRVDKRGDMRCPYEARLKRGGKDLYLGHVTDQPTRT